MVTSVLIVVAFDVDAVLEAGVGSDEGHQVGCVLTAHQRCCVDWISLNATAIPAGSCAGVLGDSLPWPYGRERGLEALLSSRSVLDGVVPLVGVAATCVGLSRVK